jgi:uncharacterized protein (DUF362 family)
MPVYFDEVSAYRVPLIAGSMRKALRELKMEFRGRRSAFIKINTVRPARPGSAVVTHPAVVEALIRVLREQGLTEIVIGEGPAAGVDVEKAFRKSGYTRLACKLSVRLLDLHKAERVKREWDNGVIELPAVLFDSDLYINAAKMKTHFHTGLTLSIKNQQGLLTPEAKKANHREYNLHRSLVSIAKVVRPHLVVIDGIESQEGEGPTQGQKKRTRVMAYGDDLFETDLACSYFMGTSPSRIEHLRLAIEDGLVGPAPVTLGEAFFRRKTPFRMPSPKPKRILNFYSWKNYRACAEDEHCFEEALHLALVKPRYWFTFFPKFFYLVLFKRIHLLRGKHAKVPDEPGRLLCIGNCCRDVADANGAYFVPGCPPRPEDILKTVAKMK